MPGQEKKKHSKKPVSKSKIAAYWNVSHTKNMFRRVKRVYKKYVSLSSVKNSDPLQLSEIAVREAKKCASAHGPVVEGMLARWLRGEKP